MSDETFPSCHPGKVDAVLSNQNAGWIGQSLEIAISATKVLSKITTSRSMDVVRQWHSARAAPPPHADGMLVCGSGATQTFPATISVVRTRQWVSAIPKQFIANEKYYTVTDGSSNLSTFPSQQTPPLHFRHVAAQLDARDAVTLSHFFPLDPETRPTPARPGASSQPHSHPNGSPSSLLARGSHKPHEPLIVSLTATVDWARHCQDLIARGSTASREHPMIALHVKSSSPRHVGHWHGMSHTAMPTACFR